MYCQKCGLSSEVVLNICSKCWWNVEWNMEATQFEIEQVEITVAIITIGLALS